MKERTILLHGFSKGFAMTGFRVGFACGPDWLVEAMMKIHQYCMMCAPILSQEAAVEALKNGTDDVMQMREQYQKRRDFIVRRFNEMGMTCHLPEVHFMHFRVFKPLGLMKLISAIVCFGKPKWRLYPVLLLVPMVKIMFVQVFRPPTKN